MVSLMRSRSFAYSNLLTTLLAFSVITSTTIANNSGSRTDPWCTPTFTAPINSRPNVVVRSPTPFGLGRNGCWPFRESQLPWALPSHKTFFRLAAYWTTAEGQHPASLKSGACLLYSPASLFPVFIFSFFSSRWAARFILTLAPSFPVQCALEMCLGGVSQCNATPASNGSI